MGGDLESPVSAVIRCVFAGALRGGQGAGRIQLHQIIIIEHTFNIRRSADTFPRPGPAATNGQHLTIRTTTAGFRACGKLRHFPLRAWKCPPARPPPGGVLLMRTRCAGWYVAYMDARQAAPRRSRPQAADRYMADVKHVVVST